jgi:cysteine-rich repeat protein
MQTSIGIPVSKGSEVLLLVCQIYLLLFVLTCCSEKSSKTNPPDNRDSGIDSSEDATDGAKEPIEKCGNSVLESSESCDDGNIATDDDCDSNCRIHQPCVDGIFHGSVAIKERNDVISLADCRTITGDLTIVETSLANLNGLEKLELVEGELRIRNNYALDSLNGLIGLVSIEGFVSIHANVKLRSLDGLGNLRTVGGLFQISGNDNLLNLDGLESLILVGDTLSIFMNPALVDIDKILTLQECRRVSIERNESLLTCSATSVENELLSRGSIDHVIVCGNYSDACGSDRCMDPP